MASNTLNLIDLPPHLIENIFKHLNYKELDEIRSVCNHFHAIGIDCMKNGIEGVLQTLHRKMVLLENELMEPILTLDNKITLNQTYTTLKLLKMHVYSLYVLRRHFLNEKCHVAQFGVILDQITAYLSQMKEEKILNWLKNCLNLQNIISKFNIYNMDITDNKTLIYPFGVHVIDILDVLTDINYNIQCVYNFQECSCTVFAYYYTENIKFLTYMPDINFIKDCQDRYLTKEEKASILKYLLALVNLYNGLHGKKEEYDREMQFASEGNPTFTKNHPIESHFCRNVVQREYISNNSILEMYMSREPEQKALLGCRVELICPMNKAPFKISKSLELLRRDLYLNNSTVIQGENNEQTSSKVNYAVEINLKFIIKHKMQELFDISIKDINIYMVCVVFPSN